MKRTLVLCVSWKGPSTPTRRLLEQLAAAGADVMLFEGVTDVALARSLAIARALERADQRKRDMLLLLDDDIEAHPDQCAELVELARKDGPTSGVYGTAEGRVAATRWQGRWLVGLGFCAVPVRALLELDRAAPLRVEHSGYSLRPWCCSGVHPKQPGRFTSEDYWFCLELGGVRLAPIGARHYKLLPVVVPEKVLDEIQALNASPEPVP